MSRKPILPGVDEESLAKLARQFPPSSTGADRAAAEPKLRSSSPPAADQPKPVDPVIGPPPITSTPPAAPRGSGRGFAVLALLASLIALVLAGANSVPPSVYAWVENNEWLRTNLNSPAIVAYLTERQAALDARFEAEGEARDGVDSRLKVAVGRIEAIEAVGGSSEAAAKRVDAAEAAVKALDERLAAAENAGKALQDQIAAMLPRQVQLASSLAAAEGRITAGEAEGKRVADLLDAGSAETKTVAGRIDAQQADIKTVADRLAAVDEANRRALGELSVAVDALKKVDRRPERLYLAALQLRNATQGSAPYAKELAQVTPFAAESEEIRTGLRILSARAESGVPTVQDLRTAFAQSVAPRLAQNAPSSRETMAERSVGWVRSLFSSASTRPDQSESRNAAAIALAERSMADGRLSAAVDQLLILEDRAQLIAAEWLRDASARLAIDKAATSVVSQAFERYANAP